MNQDSTNQQSEITDIGSLSTPSSMSSEPDPDSATSDDLWMYIRSLQEQLRQSTAREAYLLAHVQSRLPVSEERELRQATIQLQAERELLNKRLTAIQQRYTRLCLTIRYRLERQVSKRK
jgi:hypothetical protein